MSDYLPDTDYKVQIKGLHQRRKIIQDKILAHSRNTKKHEQRYWVQGELRMCPVIDLPVDLPVYHLNNGRTRSAQSHYMFNNSKSSKFFANHQEDNLQQRIQHKLLIKAVNYDLAITRSGASAISELAYLNIPFVAIPFPYAKDNHQYYNAEFYEKKKCCWLIMQKDIDEKSLINLMQKIFEDQNEYYTKKNNLIKLSKENTWEKNKSKLIELINEN